MLFKRKVGVYCGNRMKHANIFCGQNAEHLDIKAGYTYTNRQALKGYVQSLFHLCVRDLRGCWPITNFTLLDCVITKLSGKLMQSYKRFLPRQNTQVSIHRDNDHVTM
jgi:hypothetical protein